VIAIYAGVNGYLDKIPVPQVPRFHEELREHLRTESSVLEAIREQGEISEEIEEKLKAELEHFLSVFNVEEEKGIAG
jgi:F-type H+/Na+-transporting ATPase subunit alpha